MPHKFAGMRVSEVLRLKKASTQNARLLTFLNDLRAGRIHYRLDQHRQDAIMVEVAVPGERWEIEFLDDGGVEAEVFVSDGNIRDSHALDDLLRRHSEAVDATQSRAQDAE